MNKNEFLSITKLMLNELKERLVSKNINIIFDNNVEEKIVNEIKEENYGARPIRKIIKNLVEDELTKYLIDNPNVKNISCFVENNLIKIKSKDE